VEQRYASSLQAVLPRSVRRLCDTLRRAGHRSWVVGGAVRDVALAHHRGQAVAAAAERCDWDIATDAHPQRVTQLFRRVVPTGIDHGTVTVLLEGASHEVTTLRGEGTYSDGRHPDGVRFIDTIEADLARRDFTVNAIAYDPHSKSLFDPYGGLNDLRRGVLRAVGTAEERFAEDGLRVLRAARFVATLELTLDEETERAIPRSLASYRKVSVERIRDEWLKAFKAPRPSTAFRLMQKHGMLAISAPALVELVGCEQNRFHAFDAWEHTLLCMDACPPRPLLRLAALLHDVGKPAAREFNNDKKDYTFYEHERLGAKLARGLLEGLRFSSAECARVEALVRHHIVQYDDSWSDAAIRRWVRRVTPDRVEDVLSLNRADVQSKGTHYGADDRRRIDRLEQRVADVLAQGAALSVRDLAVNGHDLMSALGLGPGPRLGQLLNGLLEHVIEDPGLNEREKLLDLARSLD
jgi:tRNA nucleotidyltransferase (CCA-adding enzyme)